MGIATFKRIFGQRRQAAGDLGYFGLGTWWTSAFSSTERQYMEAAFAPGGSRSLTQGRQPSTFPTAAALLVALASHLSEKAEDRDLGARVLSKAEERALAENDLIGLHFVYQETIRLHYKWRETFRNALDLAFAACHKQMQYAAQAAEALQEAFPERPLPAHFGFQRAASILEQRKAYEQALKICRRAKQQGWAGNWTWRMQRIQKKLRERGYSVVSMSSSGMSQI
ncbi:MAG: hypothetical protein JW741_22805 [Sedimentisphaerales bacterium]|nr:hypothetical protein [Sedimentisphaerales bacterium]